jgi:hypothetical protein
MLRSLFSENEEKALKIGCTKRPEYIIRKWEVVL